MTDSTRGAEVRQAAEEHLRRLVGRADAAFRDGQYDAIEALVVHRERVLVVQRTGWGKSAVYFVATALRRAEGAGPTLIVSPLLALMRDQVEAARRAGIRAVTINSSNAEEWGDVAAALAADEIDVLLVSPERLNNPRFRAEQLPGLAAQTGLLVVDEAHCVSDWGHDFRPDYRRIKDLLAELPFDTPVLGTTATANARVVADIAEQLGVARRASEWSGGPGEERAGRSWSEREAERDQQLGAERDHRSGVGGRKVLTLRGPLARDSLRLGVLALPTSQQRLAWLATHLGDLPGSGIVYALTVSGAEDLAAVLRDAGYDVRAYTGRTDPAERQEAEDALRHNQVKALVATSALGMGFDKPDLGFVVHVGAPSSPIAYYQQVGRAGRATDRADVLLLPGMEDRDIWHYFATASMPRQEHADAVLTALAEAGRPLSTPALETLVDVRRTRLELLLKVLDVEGAVEKAGGGWRATGRPWTYDAERYARVAKTRSAEAAAMLAYQKASTCRMAFLQQALDDPTASDCGRCDNCAGPWYPTDVAAEATAVAQQRLRRAGVELEPRASWPSGMDRLGVPVKGRIPEAERAATGRVLARLTDLGWGRRLSTLLAPDAPDAPVDDTLLDGCVEVLRQWGWARRPHGVVAMAARRRPRLVSSLAAGIARIGRLPLLGTIGLAHGGPVGEAGGNSAFRLAGLRAGRGGGWGFTAPDDLRHALAKLAADVGEAPTVLLVDDLVDSRWTLTVAARELRLAGAAEVLPFALAQSG